MTRSTLATCVAALLFVLTSGCGQATEASLGNTAEAQRAQWQKADVRDYTWSVFVGCFCDPGTATIKVVDGKPVNARDERGPFSIERDEKFGVIPLTIDELFGRLDQAYANGADTVDVTYDPTFGFPSELRIDPSKNTADDEMEYSVKSFQPAA